MAKQIKNTDLYQKDIFDNFTESAAAAAQSVDVLEARLTELQETSAKIGKAAKKQMESIKIDKPTIDSYEKLEKLERKLKEATSELAVEETKLKVQIQEAAKATKEQAKDELKINKIYQKKSKILNEARKEYKNLRLEQGKSTKETKKLRKEIEKLDKELKDVDAEVGQFQRDVGNYPKTTGAAKAGLATLSGFLTGIFVSAVGKSRDQVREFQGGLERVGNVVRVIAQEIILFFNNVALPSLENISLKFEKLTLNIESFTNGVGGDEGINKRLKELDKELKENTKSIDGYSFSWSEMSDILDKTDSNIVTRIERNDRLIDKTAKLNDEIQKLQITEQVLESSIGNSNFSMQQREGQIQKLIVVQDQIIGKEKELAEENFKSAATSIRNDLLRRKLIKTNSDISDQQLKDLSFLKDKAKSDAISLDNLAKLTAATTALNEVEGRSQLQDSEALKELLDNRRDLFEQELDFTLDIADRQKSVNERIIASEALTIKEKFDKFAETEKLTEDSYKAQIKLTEDFIKDSASLRGLDAEQQEALNNLDLDKIVNLNDEAKIREELINKGIADEITQNRIREIIIERKAAMQDLVDLQDEIKAAAKEEHMTQQDAEFALRESRRSVAVSNSQYNTEKRIEDFEEEEKFNQKKLDSAKKSLKEQKELQKELIIEQKDFEKFRAESTEDAIRIQEEEKQALLEIEREYYDALEDLNKSAIEKQNKAKEEQRQFLIDLAKDVTSEIGKQVEQRVQDTIDGYDSEIDARKSEIDRQEGLASEGAANEIAFQEGQLAKAELNRKEALEKQRKIQEATRLGEIFLTAFEARLSSNPDTAATKAIQDTFLAKGIASGFTQIGAFEKGGLVEGGEQIIRINEKGKEFVIDAKKTKELGLDKTGSSMMDFNNMLSANNLDSHNGQIMMAKKKEHDPYLEEMKGLRGDISNKESVDVMLNKYGDVIISAQKGGKKKTVKFKTNPIQ